MKVKITIIGLGQIGTSIGLALRDQSDKVIRFGHDIDIMVAKKSKKLGAIDKVFVNLPNSVEKADVIILALPSDQIYPTMQVIAPYLQENAVVMETSPMKSAVAGWMKQILPTKRHYVGLFPAINPAYILEDRQGVESARIDLFTKGVMAITSSQGTDSAAIKLATDLASIVGANPYFINLDELDIIHAYTHVLPQIISTALVNSSVRTNAWNDAKKIAGPIYSKATHSVINHDDAPAVVENIMRNKTMTVRVLDEMISSLTEIRDVIDSGKTKKLKSWFRQAQESHIKWWEERKSGDWRTPKTDKTSTGISGLWKRLFGDMGKLLGVKKVDSEHNRSGSLDDMDEEE